MAEQSSLVRLQKEFDIELAWRPFELHPDTPRGGIPLEQYFPEPRLSMMRRHLTQFAVSFGIDDLVPAPRLANTRRVLAVAEYARDHGKLDELRNVAMHRYWREHGGVETNEDLRAIAEKAGLDVEGALGAADDPVYQQRIDDAHQEGKRRGVTGIPSFFIGPYFVVGCQPYEVLAEAVRRAGGQKRE